LRSNSRAARPITGPTLVTPPTTERGTNTLDPHRCRDARLILKSLPTRALVGLLLLAVAIVLGVTLRA